MANSEEISTSSDNVSENDGEQRPKIERKHYAIVTVLCLINLVNYMDRYTVAGILGDIQDTFDISDPQAGALQTAFIITYMVFAPLFGYLGDRYSRKNILIFGISFWSIASLSGSFMPNYWSFLLFRCLLGVGEATYTTVAPTIISDIFIKDQRSKMIAFFNFAIPVGSGLGYVVSGLLTYLAKMAKDEVDVVGSEAWRWGLRLTPILGAISVVCIILIVEEPQRGIGEGGSHLKTTAVFTDIKYIITNKTYVLVVLGFTAVTFVAGALGWWGPHYVQLGIDVQEDSNASRDAVALIFGATTAVAGVLGVPLGVYLGTKYRKKYPYADSIVCGMGLLLSTPLILGCILLAQVNTAASYVVSFFGQIFLNLNWAVASDICLYVIIPTRRALSQAILILFSHCFGDAFSPLLIGIISDAVKPNIVNPDAPLPVTDATTSTMASLASSTFTVPTTLEPPEDPYVEVKALEYAMFVVTFVDLLGAIFFCWSAFYLTKDKAKCDALIAGEKTQLTSNDTEIGSSNPAYKIDDEKSVKEVAQYGSIEASNTETIIT